MSYRTNPSSSQKSQEQANPPREIQPFLQESPRQRSPASPPRPTISYKPHKPTNSTESFILDVELELVGDLAAMDIHVWKNKTRVPESDIEKQFRPPPPNAPAPKKLKWIVGPLQCPVGVMELNIDAVQKTDRQVSEHTGNVERILPELYSEHVWTETITISE